MYTPRKREEKVSKGPSKKMASGALLYVLVVENDTGSGSILNCKLSLTVLTGNTANSTGQMVSGNHFDVVDVE